MLKCECKSCKMSAAYEVALEHVPEEHKAVFVELYEECVHAQTDAAYYRSIVEGVWPNSEEILAQYRQK